ncbi:putative glutamyl-tRNA(Gln) amidotransferase subunit A [Mycobacterium xenopi 4042]|uniref:Putative glutamyl-tRNA(Gln) amidotransferase subunit A n=1 Tax=Mycobacterium xenopi 4042 TaxID=1299334 RepID=X7Z5S1_MYCXE|nr:putative glutamyl-tRNA(Gln) amidotransferase subunit A [Mycobacterium xenopi 4042]
MAGQVQRKRAQVEQVHRQRIVDLFPQPERGGRVVGDTRTSTDS